MKKYCFPLFVCLFTSICFSQTDSIRGISENDTIKIAKIHYDVFMGTFVPTQKAKLIGVKPTFGFSIGVNYKKMTYDLTAEVRLGKTKQEYQLPNSEWTNNYMGGYLGMDIMSGIWTSKNNQILLLGGAGIDLFEIEPAEYYEPSFLEYILFGDQDIITKESRNIISYNFNFGLMYRHYNKKKNYFGIRYRFNLVNYNSKKILTDLTGNYHSITLSFGGFIKDP